MPNIEWVGSPNFTEGRGGKKIIAIVDHITAGKFPGCLSWMQNPKSEASAHYLVTKTGHIFQLVDDEDTAWHAGVAYKCSWSLYDGVNPNRYSLGIEHEALAGETLAEAQYEATLWLHRQLIKRWEIPIDNEHIVSHIRINAGHNCPGPGFPWERLFKDLEGVKVAEQWQIDIVNKAKAAGLINGDHDPNETVTFWQLCAVVLKAIGK